MMERDMKQAIATTPGRRVVVTSTSAHSADVHVDGVHIGRGVVADYEEGPCWLLIVNENAGEENEYGMTEWDGRYPARGVNDFGRAIRECVERVSEVVVNGTTI